MAYRAQDLRPGQIMLLTRNPRESLPAQLLDLAIAWSEANPMVHALLVGDGHLIDPLWRVTKHPLSLYEENGWAFTVHATEEQRRAAVAWAEARIGERYSVTELLEDGARFDLHFVAPAWYTARRQRYTCSGFCAAAWASASVTLTRSPAPAPSDLSYSPALIGPRPWEPPTGGSRALHGNPNKEA